MPLMKSKSKSAFSHNVKAEMDAGKPMKQSLAIAYATKRRAKMAKGGMVLDQDMEQEDEQDPQNAFLSHDDESPWEDEEPSMENPHESPDIDQMEDEDDKKLDIGDIVKKVRKSKMK